MDTYTTLTRNILDSHKTLGLKAPIELEKALDAIRTIGDELAKLTVPFSQFSTAIADAILDGRDPVTDPTITRLVMARQIAVDDYSAITAVATGRLADKLQKHTPKLIEQWEGVFNKAASTIAEELAVLGNVDIETDAPQILARGGDIAAHYIAAREANTTIDTIRSAIHALGQASRMFSYDKLRHWNLILVPATLDQWEEHNLWEKRSPWDLARLGLHLELGTPSVYRKRLAAHQATRDQRLAAGAELASGRLPRLTTA